jgi:hypothetical protein
MQVVQTHGFAQGIYRKVIERETSFYFWQALYLTVHQQRGRERRVSVKRFMEQVDRTYIYSGEAKLPLRYSLMRGLFKLLPNPIATMVVTLL